MFQFYPALIAKMKMDLIQGEKKDVFKRGSNGCVAGDFLGAHDQQNKNEPAQDKRKQLYIML